MLFVILIGAGILYLFYGRTGSLNSSGSFFNIKREYSIDDEYNAKRASEQKELDALLDKVGKKGFETLSKKEKARLKDLSK